MRASAGGPSGAPMPPSARKDQPAPTVMVTGVVTNDIQRQLRSTSSTASPAVHVLMPTACTGGGQALPSRPALCLRTHDLGSCRGPRLD